MTKETNHRKRQGSPWKGLWAVIGKEMSDHLTSARMQILEVLIVLTAVGTGYTALQQISSSTNDQFLFLQLFTTAREPLPAFAGFMGFLVPLVSIALAFDSVNGEFNRRTISRVLSQPIYRDALLFGKFLGTFFTLALVLAAIWLLIFGIGLIGLGVPPSGQETARILIFLALTIFYGGFWLSLGLLFSTKFQQSATAALASIGVWLFFIAFWEILVSLVAQSLRPIQFGVLEEIIARAKFEMMLSRLSPNTLFVEATLGILNPTIRTLGLILPFELEGAIMGSALPVEQSFLMIWPHLTGLIATTILIFALSYISFQRREIRA
ncbi:MAG: Putative ABC transporter permease protein [Anaerolinea thermophila]|uniref:Putative ABC transporter permease protein n=1 Tax=Anaerolinea thermophila TaxID=167964 RepID=A0A117LGM5_9CHLR|nr:MAG: Putative ABC transporter permease protein [Anaerolinea thermophila]